MDDPWAEPLTKRQVQVAQSTSSSSDSDLDSHEEPPKGDDHTIELAEANTTDTGKRVATLLLPNPEDLLGKGKRPKFLDPEALRDLHSYERPETRTKDTEKCDETEKEFDIARMAPPLKVQSNANSIKSKAVVYDRGVGEAPRTDPKKPLVKDREKSKRTKGQSTHSTWKSEGEMLLRQQYD